jgi:hypothetical protein
MKDPEPEIQPQLGKNKQRAEVVSKNLDETMISCSPPTMLHEEAEIQDM